MKSTTNLLGIPRWILYALQAVALVNMTVWYALATSYYPSATLPWWVLLVLFYVTGAAVVGAVAVLVTRAAVGRFRERRGSR